MSFFYIWAKVILKDITVTLIDRDGNKHLLKAPLDMNMNLMELCKSHGFEVQGICGGMAMCASCQIYIHSELPISKASEDELAMLSEAFNVKKTSRLGCQIPITKEIEGIVFELAPE